MPDTAVHRHGERNAVPDIRTVPNDERSFLLLPELVAAGSVAGTGENPLQVRAAQISDLRFAIKRQLIPDDAEALPETSMKWVDRAEVSAGTRTVGRGNFDFHA